MKIKDVKDLVFTALTPFAQELGFTMIDVRHFSLFYPTDDDISISIEFTYESYENEIELFPWVTIASIDISEICEDCDVDLYDAAYINLLVLEQIKIHGDNEQRINKALKNKGDRIILRDDSEWYYTFTDTMKRLLPLALGYINRFRTLEAIDREYNSLPLKINSPIWPDLRTRCFAGIIAAKLTHNPNYTLLKQQYSDIVTHMNYSKQIQDEFYNIIDFIDDAID